jgi:hypothetical protein
VLFLGTVIACGAGFAHARPALAQNRHAPPKEAPEIGDGSRGDSLQGDTTRLSVHQAPLDGMPILRANPEVDYKMQVIDPGPIMRSKTCLVPADTCVRAAPPRPRKP